MRQHKNQDKKLIEKLESQYNVKNVDGFDVDDFDAYNSHLRNFKEQMKVKKVHRELKPNSRVSKLIKSLEVPKGLKIEGSKSSSIHTSPEEILEVKEELKPALKVNENKIRNRLSNFFRFNDYSNRKIKDARYVDPLYYEFDLKNMTPEKEIEIMMGADSELLGTHPLLGAREFSEEVLERRRVRKEERAKAREEKRDEEDVIPESEDDEDFNRQLAKFQGKKIDLKSATDLIGEGENKLDTRTPEERAKEVVEQRAERKRLEEEQKRLEAESKEKDSETKDEETQNLKLKPPPEIEQEEEEEEAPAEEVEKAVKRTEAATQRRREINESYKRLKVLQEEKKQIEENPDIPQTGKEHKLKPIEEEIRSLYQTILTGNLTTVEAYDNLMAKLLERNAKPTIPKGRNLPEILQKDFNTILLSLGITNSKKVSNEKAFKILTGEIPVQLPGSNTPNYNIKESIDRKRPREKLSSKSSTFGAKGVMTINDLEPDSPINNFVPEKDRQKS